MKKLAVIALVAFTACAEKNPNNNEPFVKERISPEMLEASAILGAGEMRTALRVLLPLCRPGLVTALLFSFIISLDEVTVTMFLTGPDVMTLPVEIYAYIQENASPVLAAVSTAMVVATLALVLLLERLVGLQVFVEEEGS